MEETASKVPLASGEDFLNSYQTIASKLKRKFLRKPNVSDAEEEFNSLARQLEQQEQHSHAAVCHLAAARCEGTLGNPFGEAESLIKGARAFLAAEQENRKLSLPAQEEHLMAAMSVFNHAIKVYLEQKQKLLASRFCLELANALKEFGKLREALAYYQKSIEMEDNQTLGQLNSQELVASCFIEMCDYHAALSTFDGMRGTLDVMKENGVHEAPISGLLRKCEVMQVLLLLLLQIPPAQMKKEYSLLLSKYTFEDEPLEAYLSEDLFHCLQSLVLACQSQDLPSLHNAEASLWPHLTSLERDLVRQVCAVVENGPIAHYSPLPSSLCLSTHGSHCPPTGSSFGEIIAIPELQDLVFSLTAS